jgi:cyclopropane fatty-acyl-phospholipid synthase-like methyltransferase
LPEGVLRSQPEVHAASQGPEELAATSRSVRRPPLTHDKTPIALFYDAFVPQQRRAAFNERHLFLAELLVALGLKEGSTVLELGCGIGVITSLIARRNRGGRIVAVDLSPASIEAARASLVWARNVEFACADVVEYSAPAGFEPTFVTLFDVLEHIPIEQHAALFGKVARHMTLETELVINIPSPGHLEYLRRHEPEKLQIVDQPLPADHLVRVASGAGLDLAFFVTYSLWMRDDYQVMSFRLRRAFRKEALGKPSRWTHRWQVLFQRLATRTRRRSLLWWLGAR